MKVHYGNSATGREKDYDYNAHKKAQSDDCLLYTSLQGMGFKSKLTSETDKDKVGDIIKGMGARYSTRNLNTNNTQRDVYKRQCQCHPAFKPKPPNRRIQQ